MMWTRYTTLIAAVVICACETFGGSDDDFDTSTGGFDDESSTDTDEPPPPTEGFRVFPKYKLQDVPAIVTVDFGVTPEPCVLDDNPQGGYVCDTGHIFGVTATLRIEKDGFDTAVRHPEIVPNQIDGINVHLSFEGGPTGTWSDCAPADAFETCADLCGAQMLPCSPTSCATGQDEFPVATLETFAAPDCGEVIEGIPSTCEMLPIAPDVASVHCCCEG